MSEADGGSVSKQLFKYDAGIDRHRQRNGWRSPTDGFRIDTVVVETAGAAQGDVIDRELNGRQPGILPESLGVELIDRGAVQNIGAYGLLGVRAGQKHCARTKVISAAFRREEGFGRTGIGAADDGD